MIETGVPFRDLCGNVSEIPLLVFLRFVHDCHGVSSWAL